MDEEKVTGERLSTLELTTRGEGAGVGTGKAPRGKGAEVGEGNDPSNSSGVVVPTCATVGICPDPDGVGAD
jgi:hypothetical protein